jgi:DMSO/TMAO reductase YedYZ molybdopterin-dependent catalytic subunit
MPVTQWFLDGVPRIDPDSWHLVVSWPGGEQTWAYADLLHAADDPVQAIIDCTGGWYAAQRWRGIWLDHLLPHNAAHNSVSVVSVTGYQRRLPGTDTPRLLLATHVAGQPLSSGHGAPARLVAPGRRGFWWVKWVHRIELDDRPWWLQPPLPLR